MIAKHNIVVAYGEFKGTFAGTGETVNFPYMAFWNIQDGKIADLWVEWNNSILKPQTNLAPPIEDLINSGALTIK